MPIHTELLSSVDSWLTDATQDILFQGAWLKMNWVHAGAVPAKVIQRETFCYRSDQHFVGNPVSVFVFTCNSELSVTT